MARYDGLAEFVVGRGPGLLRAAYLLTGDGHLAEDLVQSTLVKVAPRWERIVAAGDPEAYVRRALYNEHVNGWRRFGRFGERPSAATPETGRHPDHADDAVRTLVLARALRRLTPRQRAVLVLRFYEDRTAAETARLLDCSVGTVKSQTHRALARLRLLEPGLADLLNDVNVEANR
ncbi:SigE family RNA polymerase sigma factor [Actinomadura flavalba]|uniref:SigE family RNA polymerase sigma factor n=1 Tax=Actinomadura flavalba TaxID=1120938 RepID=UPI00039FC98B|nr:SigE family RNA polymerase sigma factor [Actinomadura flavalba]